MNTHNTPRTTSAAGHTIHTSQRSAISENTLANGERVRSIESSRLVMSWVAGELKVWCDVSRVNLPGGMQMRPSGRARGAR
ncbi:MAG: hypothetical protein EON54_05235 [Alcaligenaceae bacterium]|nr:MAG: hypothetical protein EON54_05235 [Alcaligenaceae bacterium]